jgi:hypothetical protein
MEKRCWQGVIEWNMLKLDSHQRPGNVRTQNTTFSCHCLSLIMKFDTKLFIKFYATKQKLLLDFEIVLAIKHNYDWISIASSRSSVYHLPCLICDTENLRARPTFDCFSCHTFFHTIDGLKMLWALWIKPEIRIAK